MTNAKSDFFDVIVVGGGSAGCTLAARLSEQPDRSVLLIEAGIDYGALEAFPLALRDSRSNASSMPGHPDSWSMVATVNDGRRYPITRGRVLGGSSAVNGVLFTRGHPNDYDEWVALGNPGWSYDEVLPYFKKLETDLDFPGSNEHGVDGPMPVKRPQRERLSAVSEVFIETCLNMGFSWDADLNGTGTGGVGLLPANSLDGVRQNVAVRYVDPIRSRPNLTIRDRCTVRQVMVSGSRAVGVMTNAVSGAKTVYGDEIVLCAGGILSPKLLMLSGVGPAAELEAAGISVAVDLPAVGKNLTDHPVVSLPFTVADRFREGDILQPVETVLNYSTADPLQIGAEDVRLMPFLFSKQEMLTGARAARPTSPRRQALEAARNSLRTLSSIRGTSLSALRHDVTHRADLTMFCGLSMEASRGEIRIDSDDPDASPVVDFNYLSEPGDLERIDHAAEMALELFASGPFQRVGAKVRVPEEIRTSRLARRRWIAENLGTSYHTSCTCRMGPNDGSNVVDAVFRVHGVEKLRIVDLSVMPSLVRRPPNASVIMLAERAASFMSHEKG